jgi:hypothetical protein
MTTQIKNVYCKKFQQKSELVMGKRNKNDRGWAGVDYLSVIFLPSLHHIPM